VRVIFWGLASRLVDEVIDLYASREEAEEALADVLGDEPGWEDLLFVARVELAGPQPSPSLN
jgi:hypothetical protein